MSLIRLGLLTSLAAVLHAAPVAAQHDAVQLAPISAWSLEYAEDSCALRRTFGSEQEPTWLEFRLVAPSETYRITVASRQFDRCRFQYPVATFLPNGVEERYPLAAFGEYGEGGEGVVWYQRVMQLSTTRDKTLITQADGSQVLEREPQNVVEGLSLANVFESDLIFETGNMNEAFAALDECSLNLMRHLGIDWNNIRTQPTLANSGEWEVPILRRYPSRMLQARLEGVVTLRVIVNAQGRPSSCIVQEPVVDDNYQGFVCRIVMDNAEYEPARNVAGEAVSGVHFQHIVYTIN